MEFYGLKIRTTPGDDTLIEHSDHIEGTKLLPNGATFDEYHSSRSTLAFITHARPDIACYVNKAAQVTEEFFDQQKVKEFNSCIKYLKKNQFPLRFGPLNTNTLQIRVYADAASETNLDCSSQLRFVILICDASNSSHFIDFSSKKSRRVVRSMMRGEIFALADGFDRSLMLRHDLETIYSKRIPLHVFTDSKQVFGTITKASKTTERRLLIDIAASRQAYNRHEISNISPVASEDMIADDLTKTKSSPSWMELLKSGNNVLKVKQWIVRN